MTTKGNSKDGFENVDGKPASKRMPAIGMRVTGAAVTEGKDGAAISHVTVAGYTKGLVGMLGQQLGVKSASSVTEFMGKLVGVSVKLGKDDKPIWTSKIAGARDLDRLVGLQVSIEPTQGQLGLDDARDNLEPPPAPKRSKKGRGRGAEARA